MKRPETAAYLSKARLSLTEARVLAANDLADAAGRAAYLAAFHADYAIGGEAGITVSEAEQAIASAIVFVDGVAKLLKA